MALISAIKIQMPRDTRGIFFSHKSTQIFTKKQPVKKSPVAIFSFVCFRGHPIAEGNLICIPLY